MTPLDHGSPRLKPAPPPTMIAGRYEVLEETERPGGFTGYKVRHLQLDALLMLTAVPDDVVRDPKRLARVQAAARAAGGLRHDQIIPVHDLVEDDGRWFVVEPFVDGTPLDRVAADTPLDPGDALHLVRQLADALAYAHTAGVMHGTVSAANVVVEAGTPPRARLSGFALDAMLDPGSAIPTRFLRYTAPERLAGRDADAPADVFALGQVIYELFEGRPFLVGKRGEIETLLRDGTAPFVPRFSRVVPAGLSGLVARMIRRSPGERQQQMAHVRADLDGCLRAVGQRAVDTSPPPPPMAAPQPATIVATATPPVAATPPSEPAPSARTKPASRPVAVPPRARTVARLRPSADASAGWRALLPARPPRREATFPSRILVRASEPRTPVGGKLLVVGVLLALGWVVLPYATPPPGPTDTQPIAKPAAPPAGADDGRAATPPPTVAPPADAAVEIAAPAAPASRSPVEIALATPAPAPPEPPRIEAREPTRERITLAPGQSMTFRVRAADRLNYVWMLDGSAVGEGAEWRMVAPPPGQLTTHTVEVEVTDPTGPTASRLAWTVDVAPPARPKAERKKPAARPTRR